MLLCSDHDSVAGNMNQELTLQCLKADRLPVSSSKCVASGLIFMFPISAFTLMSNLICVQWTGPISVDHLSFFFMLTATTTGSPGVICSG